MTKIENDKNENENAGKTVMFGRISCKNPMSIPIIDANKFYLRSFCFISLYADLLVKTGSE